MFGFEAYETMIGFVVMNALIVAGVFVIMRKLKRKRDSDAKPTPLNILNERLAKGEIDQPEYDKLSHTIAHS